MIMGIGSLNGKIVRITDAEAATQGFDHAADEKHMSQFRIEGLGGMLYTPGR